MIWPTKIQINTFSWKTSIRIKIFEDCIFCLNQNLWDYSGTRENMKILLITFYLKIILIDAGMPCNNVEFCCHFHHSGVNNVMVLSKYSISFQYCIIYSIFAVFSDIFTFLHTLCVLSTWTALKWSIKMKVSDISGQWPFSINYMIQP